MAAFFCWWLICSGRTGLDYWAEGPWFIVASFALSLIMSIHFFVFYSRYKLTTDMQKYFSQTEINEPLNGKTKQIYQSPKIR